ncbi:hypothetical protein COLINT_01984 [Collinsella intestinalis DSM 13280]|uniref:Uncharacterized protein n=1 Tax=Collinsella intestinalis DSM 13280 TaxID=521003 RepID=C4F7G9_9ACTN|nr:hypothetical protein COLINT_01984 [Collinsella intestinalis DSM 13280]
MLYARFIGACFDATGGRNPSIKRHRRCFGDALGVFFRLRVMHSCRLHCDIRRIFPFDALSKKFPVKDGVID